MQDGLKACAHCGQPNPHFKRATWWRLCFIRCSNDKCMVEVTEYYDDQLSVINRWNRRVEESTNGKE